MIEKLLICATIFIPSLTSSIQAKDRLTLRDAITLSLLNNNKYKISIEAVNESRLKVRETWGMLWPKLSTDVVYARQWAESGFNSTLEGQYDIKFINCEIAINPGVFHNSLQASRNGHIIAMNNFRRIKEETIITTIKLYYRLLLAKETVELRRDSLKALEENLKTVTIGYDKGTFSKLDFLRAKVTFSNERTMLINAENDYLTALSALNIQLGKDINEPLEISAIGIDEENREFVSEVLKSRNDIDLVNSMIKDALKNRPEIIQIRNKKEAEEHSAKANQAIYLWPTFFLQGNYGSSKIMRKGGQTSTGDPEMDQMMMGLTETFSPSGWNDAWAISLGATYRFGALSPLDPSHAKKDQNKSKAKQTKFEMDDLIKGIKLEIKSGYLKLKSASNSLVSQEGNIETAEETVRVSIIQFRNGIIDNTKLLEANVQLTTAKALYIQSLYDYQVSKAELNKAIGKEYFTIK